MTTPSQPEPTSPSLRCFCGGAHLSGTCMFVSGREALRNMEAAADQSEPWPFAPGDVVRDSGEDGDDAAWLDAAPERTVVSDLDGDEWTRKNDGLWWMNRGRTARAKSVDLCTHVGPLTVVSVPTHAARPDAPSAPVLGSPEWDAMVRENFRPIRESGANVEEFAEVARTIAQTGQEAPAAPAVGVRTPGVGTGAPGGPGELGLGDAIRAIIPATYADDGYFGVTALEIGEFAERADALEAQITSLRELAAELTFKGKGEPDDTPDEFELARDEVAYMIRKRLGDAQ